jgi:hypothetical protein
MRETANIANVELWSGTARGWVAEPVWYGAKIGELLFDGTGGKF